MAEFEGAEKHIDSYYKLSRNEKITEWEYTQMYLHADMNIRTCLLKYTRDNMGDKPWNYFKRLDECESNYYSRLPSRMNDVIKVAKSKKLNEVYEKNIVIKDKNRHILKLNH